MTIDKMSIQVNCHTHFPVIYILFYKRVGTMPVVSQKETPWACIKGPAQAWPLQLRGKLFLTGPPGFIVVWRCSSSSGHLMALSTKTSHPPPLSRHYRHHCPQNGWQLLEIPGCVTTLRCTCCAIYVPPVLMPQQPERQKRIMPTTAQAANSCCRLIVYQSYGLIISLLYLATSCLRGRK